MSYEESTKPYLGAHNKIKIEIKENSDIKVRIFEYFKKLNYYNSWMNGKSLTIQILTIGFILEIFKLQ